MSNINWDEFEQKGGEDVSDRSYPSKDAKVGEGVTGRYIAKKENVGKHSKNIYVLQTQDGEKVDVWGSTVIDSKFDGVAIGKMVAIEYIGDKPSKNGQPYHDYKFGTGIDHVGDEKQI